eukprot:1296903-Alexandrium_andersonii.AAC.1
MYETNGDVGDPVISGRIDASPTASSSSRRRTRFSPLHAFPRMQFALRPICHGIFPRTLACVAPLPSTLSIQAIFQS